MRPEKERAFLLKNGFAVSAICLMTVAPSWAQEANQSGPAAPGQAGRRAREEAYRIVDAYVVSNLQESLGLSDEQFVQLLPLVKKLQTERRAFAQRRVQAMQELRRSLASGVATEARVGELLRE